MRGRRIASHAEVLSVPKNLCVHLPEDVSFESGAYGTLGAIAFQVVRLAEPTLGQSVVVIGFGLVGPYRSTSRSEWCRGFGLDLDQARVSLALEMGTDQAIVSSDAAPKEIEKWTHGHSADAVLIAATTDTDQPIEFTAQVSRLKGRVIIIGMFGNGRSTSAILQS